MSRLSLRLGKLEAAAPPAEHDRNRRFAIVRGSLAEAEELPARLGLIADQEWPVLVTEREWNGGEPVLVSPLCTLSEMSDEGLRFMASLFIAKDGGSVLLPDTVIVPCVVQLEAA